MSDTSFARARQFLDYNLTGKWLAILSSASTAVLYMVLLGLLGLFVDLVVSRGELPPYYDLPEAEKSSLLGRFAGTVAHEVRNSLNFINLSIDQVRAKHSRTDERSAREFQRNLANIKEEVSRLTLFVTKKPRELRILTCGQQLL